MDFESFRSYPPGDPALVDKIVCQLKSQGIFDQFRKECISDVDTKPAYQNLRQRVDGSVAGFLANQEWKPDLNKNQLRESLRKHVQSGGFLEVGVERIVDQVVNPKICQVFLPQVKEVVYECLGIKPPKIIGEIGGTPVCSVPITIPPPSIELRSLDVNITNNTSIEEPKSANNSEIKDSSNHFSCDNEEEKISSPSFNPLDESDSSLDSHVSGITELASHSSLSLNVSKESNELDDKDIVESNDLIHEDLIKSEDSNIDSMLEAPVLLQSDTNTNISAFDLDSIADVHDHLKSDYDENTQNGKETPVTDNIVYSDDEMTNTLNPVHKVKDELLANVSDFSKNDSDDYSLSNDACNDLKNDNWDKKHKCKSEKSDVRKSERKKDDVRKRYRSEHKNEKQDVPVDHVERTSLNDESEMCEMKCSDEKPIDKIVKEKIMIDGDKIHKSSDDEKERKEIKIHNKSKNREKCSKKDGDSKVHHSKENHHHRHSLKEKYAKDFSHEDSRDSKDSSSSNNIDKKSDKSKLRDRNRDHKRIGSLEESDKFKESSKGKERNKSESSDGKHRDSIRSRHHSDSKSKSRSESDSRDRHHHHHHYHHSKEEKQEDSKEKLRDSSKEDKKEGREHRKESFRGESSQSRESKDVKRKDDCHKSKSKEDKSNHHRRDRHDSSLKNKEKRHHEHSKSDKSVSVTESRKDVKKSAHRSHNIDKEKSSPKHASEVNKHRNEEKSYDKHDEKHKKDERSRSKKGREQCKSSSKYKDDRRSTDRDSSGSGERGGGLSHVSHSVNARQRETKDKGNITNKNVSENSASDSTEVSVDEKATCLSNNISGHTDFNEEDLLEEIKDKTSQYVLNNISSDCTEINLNKRAVNKNISDKHSTSAGDDLDSLMVGDTNKCIFNSCRAEICEIETKVDVTSANKIEPINIVVDSTKMSLKEIRNDESLNCSVVGDIKFVDNSNNSKHGNVVSDFVIGKSELDKEKITIERKVDGTDNITVDTIQSSVEVSVGNVANEHFCNFSAHSQSIDGERIVRRDSEITPMTLQNFKKLIAAKWKLQMTNIFVYKKLAFIKKSVRKIHLHRVKMQNDIGVNDGFFYFKNSEIQKAKENINNFNYLFKKIESSLDFEINAVRENFVKNPVTISLKKFIPGSVESRSSIYKINSNVDSSENLVDDKILPKTGISSDLNQFGVIVKAVAVEDEKIVKNKSYLACDYLSASKLAEQKNLLNDVKRSPVKLRISVKNPYDCKIIDVDDVSSNKSEESIENNFSHAIPLLKKKEEVPVAPNTSNDSLFIKESVRKEVQQELEESVFSKENEYDNAFLNVDAINSPNSLKRKRGRPKRKVIKSSVQSSRGVTKEVLVHDCSRNIMEKESLTSSIVNSHGMSLKESLDLKQTNSVVQKVDVPRVVLCQAISPKSPCDSAGGSYIQSRLGDAAIPFDEDVARCCVLSRTDKSHSYKTSICDPDHKSRSTERYACTSPVDENRSHSASKNVDIISPNRLNNNFSDTSDCADEGQLNEGESYLTNSIIGEALKDLMQESGLIGGYAKASVDKSSVTALKTGKQRKQSTKKGRNMQENQNVTSSRTSGRLSGSSKHMQRYDNSDLYKPRLGFRLNKRSRSPEMSLRGSGANKAETGYSSLGTGPPLKRAR